MVNPRQVSSTAYEYDMTIFQVPTVIAYQRGVAVAFGAEARFKIEEDDAKVLEIAEGFKLLSCSLPPDLIRILTIILDFTLNICARTCF